MNASPETTETVTEEPAALIFTDAAAVQVTVRDARPNGSTATQSFPWSVDVQP